jgi:hypothetical protein
MRDKAFKSYIAANRYFRERTTGIPFNLCLLVSLALLLWLHYDTYRAHNKGVEFAYGCDDFGYLRQARLFQQNGLIGGLNTAITDENTTYLIGRLRSLAEPPSWAHMVGPHCHNYKSQTNHVIIQYPPLTGLLLSLFAEGVQARLDLALVGVLLIGFLSLTAINSRAATVPLLAAALGAFLFLGLKRYGWSWSIMGSTLLLTFLGYLTAATSNALIRRWRRVAEFLLGLVLGLSVGFRIANLLLVSGFIVVMGIEFIRRPTLHTGNSVLSASAGFILGLSPVLAANTINAGSPLLSTYGQIGGATSIRWGAETLWSGVRYYFVVDAAAGGYAIAAAVMVAAALFWCLLRRRHDLAKSVTIAGISLLASVCFMVMYEITITYYLFPAAAYAAATAVYCVIACENDRRGDTGRARLPLALKAATFGAVTLVAAYIPRLLELPVYRAPEITTSFSPRAIIWADLLSGTINYYLHHQSSLIVFAGEPLQDRIISAVASDGRPQFLIVDSERTEALAGRLRRRMELRPAGVAFGSEVFELRPTFGRD